MSNRSDWRAEHEDILREVGNIGAGHAASALSALLGEEVKISVTSARMCAFNEIADAVGGDEVVAAGIYLRMTGDVHGNMLLMLSLPSAKQLLRRLLPGQQETLEFNELEISALAEVGNILGGSYMNAIGTLTHLTLTQSVPAVAIDMAAAILDIGILSAGEVCDEAILIDTVISQGKFDVQGHFFLLPDPDSLTTLLCALGWCT
ncbi:chemotaxis protein CheC [Alicyclobacillus contaminans]|uniref:chemotaxis protein CheC n=1 Tax=Alicyclobacillus contaminans TaxID=392016 RepID=UPI001FE06A0A|nr:chemotaxis protein CheC [Alicyclobacillus contaminans]